MKVGKLRKELKMIARTVVGLLATAVILNSSADEFKMSSLIVPQGVSYRVTPIRFTRDVKIVEGRLDTKSIKSTDSSGDNKSSSEDHSSSDDTTTTDTSFERKVGASAKAGASLLTGIHASAEAHASAEKSKSDIGHSSRSSATKSDASSSRESSFRDADAVEDSMQGKYGDWYLTFSIILKNLDVSDTCFVKPPTGGQLSAVVVGLTQPVIVPCERQQSIAIGIDDVVCRFTMPVHDQQLSKELKALAETGDMEKLSAQIDGANFPIISRTTGKNVLQEIKLAEMKNPTTKFVLEVGDAKVLSPWKVRQRFGRASGKRGKNVTIREALEAINEKIAEDDSMPEHVFEFDSKGTLIAVSEIRLGAPNGKNDVVLCTKFNEDLETASLQPLDATVLDKPIKDYKKIEFIDLSCDDVVSSYDTDPKKYERLYHEVITWLKADKSENLRIRRVLGLYMFVSKNDEERQEGLKILKECWDKNKDIAAINWLIGLYQSDVYSNNPKKFPYRDCVSEWILSLSKDKQWVEENAEKSVLAYLIADGQTDAVVTLSKLPSFACSSNGVTALMRIAKSGNVDMAKALLKECNFDINGGNGDVGTALEWAAMNDRVEMCKFLVGLGADPNKYWGDKQQYRTAVDMAAQYNALNALRYLISFKVGGNVHNAYFCAAEAGALEAVQFLSEEPITDVNSKWNGIPLLSYAAWSGNLTLCKYLVEQGARIDDIEGVKDIDLPVSAASRKKHFEVMDFLLDKGAHLTYSAAGSLLRKGCFDWLEERILAKKIDAGNVLLEAVGLNNAESVRRFARFVDVNKEMGYYKSKWLPLCWAAQINNVDAARALISAGARVNLSLDDMCTPIQQACRAGSLDMVKFLYLDCGAILDDAIFWALKKKQKAVLDWFLDYEKDGVKQFPVNTYSHGRRGTLLMAAVEMKDPEMCEYLLNKGADIKYQPKGKCSVLEYVMRLDNLPILRYLVDQRGCVVGDEILEAAGKGSLECLKYLIEEKRMSVNYCSRNKNGFLLATAAGEGKTDVCRYLVSKGANVNFEPVYEKHFIRDDTYKTALQMAEENGHTETANYLISVGAKE